MLRMLRAAAAAFEVLITHCPRCGLSYDAADRGEKNYHTQPGGCR
ncbi:hypothetical protein HNR25_005188 [Streptomonospora salina]|uniref:Uncharacterized protein n=1 Tax=Streptomonospora salina TaxID=104205 RepID=A0A841EBB5_9ACTN|nr:hypothetical protein [Streptomonospora salina]MBB6001357.1 hypothetical protein [Streptomonospora salina]